MSGIRSQRSYGPCGYRALGRSCVTLRLAPVARNARYAIHGGRDLALVALTPPPPPPAKVVSEHE